MLIYYTILTFGFENQIKILLIYVTIYWGTISLKPPDDFFDFPPFSLAISLSESLKSFRAEPLILFLDLALEGLDFFLLDFFVTALL